MADAADAPGGSAKAAPGYHRELSGAEAQRRRNNERAWQELTGYQTSSGCPCWDHTDHVLIPKGSYGVGYSVNCWALCCCFLCSSAREEASTYRPTHRTWVFWLLIVFGIACAAGGGVFLGLHCSGCDDSRIRYTGIGMIAIGAFLIIPAAVALHRNNTALGRERAEAEAGERADLVEEGSTSPASAS